MAGRAEAHDVLGLWVMKEAAGKAMGLGIVDVEDFSVVAARGRRSDRVASGGGSVRPPLGLRVDAPETVLAVAISGPPTANPRAARGRRAVRGD